MTICIIAGGIGAAKLIEGMVACLEENELTVIVNVGDDSRMYGLYICPDFDIIAYTIAGLVDPVKKWGIKNDTFHCLEMLGIYYNETPWFNLGDKDLATHIFRTQKLTDGYDLAEVSMMICKKRGLGIKIIPCTCDELRTKIRSGNRILEFEEYFVKEKAKPRVDEILYVNGKQAKPAPGIIEALRKSDKIIIAPSNPYLSIAPILSIRKIKNELRDRKNDVAFVSPIVAGKAIKGPTAKIMEELGVKPSCVEVARFYREIASIAFIDDRDADTLPEIKALGYKTFIHDTIMDSMEKKKALARFILNKL
ncbi:MAG: 2-phospho-L-lactate transferase [Promethearchaeota archaeon]